jgi:hypothetical protein
MPEVSQNPDIRMVNITVNCGGNETTSAIAALNRLGIIPLSPKMRPTLPGNF